MFSPELSPPPNWTEWQTYREWKCVGREIFFHLLRSRGRVPLTELMRLCCRGFSFFFLLLFIYFCAVKKANKHNRKQFSCFLLFILFSFLDWPQVNWKTSLVVWTGPQLIRTRSPELSRVNLLLRLRVSGWSVAPPTCRARSVHKQAAGRSAFVCSFSSLRTSLFKWLNLWCIITSLWGLRLRGGGGRPWFIPEWENCRIKLFSSSPESFHRESEL